MKPIPGLMDVSIMYFGPIPGSSAVMELVHHDNSNFSWSIESGMISYFAVLSFFTMTVVGLLIKLKNSKQKKDIKERATLSSDYGTI